MRIKDGKNIFLDLCATECSLLLLLITTEQRVGFWYSWVFFQLEIAKPKITSTRKEQKASSERLEQWKGRRKGMQSRWCCNLPFGTENKALLVWGFFETEQIITWSSLFESHPVQSSSDMLNVVPHLQKCWIWLDCILWKTALAANKIQHARHFSWEK